MIECGALGCPHPAEVIVVQACCPEHPTYTDCQLCWSCTLGDLQEFARLIAEVAETGQRWAETFTIIPLAPGPKQ